MRSLTQALLIGIASFIVGISAHAEVIDIDNAKLEQLLKQGVPLVDVRLPSEWKETGIVSGARLLTFFDERGRYDAAAWLEKVKPIAKPDQPIIVMCRSGNRTKPVSQFLSQQAGYTTVYNVKSGIKGWIGEGKPVVPASDTIASCKANRTC